MKIKFIIFFLFIVVSSYSFNKEFKDFSIKYEEDMKIKRIGDIINNYEVAFHSYYISKKYDIPLELTLSIISVESNFTNVISRKNRNGSRDYGYMQINNFAHPEVSSKRLMKIEINIEVGVKYLQYCLKVSNNDLATAVKMYNAGVSRIKKGIVPKSTQKYCSKVLNSYNMMITKIKLLSCSKNFSQIEYNNIHIKYFYYYNTNIYMITNRERFGGLHG